MADSTSDRIATSPVAQGVCNRRISAVWLMWFINLMLFISFLPYERKIKCIFLTTLLICLFQKTFLKNYFCVPDRDDQRTYAQQKLLYSVRKIVVPVKTCRLISNIVEDRRYSGRPVKQPHGFPSAGITLFCRQR